MLEILRSAATRFVGNLASNPVNRLLVPVMSMFLLLGPVILSAQEDPDLPDQSPEEVYEGYSDILREHQGRYEAEEGEGGENPSGRHEWFMFQRTFPLAYIPAGIRQRAIESTRKIESILADAATRSISKGITTAAADARWENIGPFNIGGRTRAIIVHPTQSSTIYIGAATGGVWKNTGDPNSWTSTFDTNSALSIGSLAFDPSDPDIIYVGTGEVIGNSYSTFNHTPAYFGDGIFKSTDGGITWKNIGLDHLGTISDLYVMKHDPRIVLASSAFGGGGLFRSTDGGSTWIQQSGKGSFLGGIVFNIEVNPQNEDVILLSTDSRIFYSTDGGQSFAIAQGFNPANSRRTEIAISPSDPSRVYALAARTTPDSDERNVGEVYVSDDGGKTFRLVETLPRTFFNAQGYYNNCVSVHPTNPDIALIGGIDIYRTLNGGTSWTNTTLSYRGGNVHPDQHCIAFDPQNPNRVYIGNDGGVYRSDDSGLNWSRISESLPISQFYEIAVDQTRDFRAYGGTQDNNTLGTYGVSSWSDEWDVILGGDGFHVVIDPNDSRIIFAEYYYGSLYRINANSLSSRSYISSRMDNVNGSDFDPGAWSTPVAISEINGVLYSGRTSLWQSFDRGSNWIELKPGNQALHSAIGLGLVNEADIMSGTSVGELFYSTDGGQNWNRGDTTNKVPSRYISEIQYDPEDGNRVYVVASGTGGGHVFRSDNRGATFTNITSNLPDIPTSGLAIDPENPNIIFVGNDIGVFVTLDGGATWLPFNNGLPYVPIVDLEIHRSKRTLVAGTHGRSMFEISIENPRPVPVILTPVGGAAYQSGDTIRATWTGFLEPVRVLVSYDGGNTWDTVGVVTTGNEIVIIAPFVRTGNAIVQVVSLDGEREATSNRFSIEPRPNTDGRGSRGFRAGAISIRGDRLWAADRDAARFVQLRLPSLLPGGGVVEHSFDPDRVLDLAFDVSNDRFFVLLGDTTDFSGAEVYEMDPEGNTGQQVTLPVTSVSGIAYSTEGLVVMTPGNDGVGYVINPDDGSVIRQTTPLSGAEGARRTSLVFDGTAFTQIVDDAAPGGQFPDAFDRITLQDDAEVVQTIPLIVEDGELIDGFGLTLYGGDNELGEMVYYMTTTQGSFYIITITPEGPIGAVPYHEFRGSTELSGVTPNPTTGETLLRYRIEQGGTATLDVYNEEGSRVRESESFRVEAGSGERRLNLSGLPSGFYRAVLTGPSGDRAAATVVLLK